MCEGGGGGGLSLALRCGSTLLFDYCCSGVRYTSQVNIVTVCVYRQVHCSDGNLHSAPDELQFANRQPGAHMYLLVSLHVWVHVTFAPG